MTSASIITITIVVGLIAFMFVAAGMDNWRRIRLARIEADLKRDLLERRLPVDEIERIIRASSSESSNSAPFSNGAPSPRIEDSSSIVLAKAVETMAQAEKSEEQIAAFLEAFVLHPTRLGPEMINDATDHAHPGKAAIALAHAIQSMVSEYKDIEEIALFLDVLRRGPDKPPGDRDMEMDANVDIEQRMPANPPKSNWMEVA